MEILLCVLSFLMLIFWCIAMYGVCTEGTVENEKSYKLTLIGLIFSGLSYIAWGICSEIKTEANSYNDDEANSYNDDEANSYNDDVVVKRDTLIEVNKIIEFIYSDGDTIRLEDKEFRLKNEDK